MHHQNFLTANIEFDTRRLVRQPVQQGAVDRVVPARPNALRPQEYFFVVTLDNMRPALPQQRDDLVGKPVFEDAVAET